MPSDGEIQRLDGRSRCAAKVTALSLVDFVSVNLIAKRRSLNNST